ncbi:MAG: aldo/keto reductase [Bradymonadia bacterium]
MHTLKLNNGLTLPAFGLGTWKSAPGEVKQAVVEAVKAGYRHIDCAWIYGNEAEVGQAFAELFAQGVVTRDDLWVTSKLWNDRHRPEDVAGGLAETLSNLGLDHLDLYLIHWPVAHKKGVVAPETGADQLSLDEVPLAETWGAMEALVDAGTCRSIGVSNFSVAKLTDLMGKARIAPVANQVESHPYLQQPALFEYCKSVNIALTAYSPLGSGDRAAQFKPADEPVLLEDTTIVEIAEGHGASPAQVLIAWALQRGTSVIPKSVNPGRIRQNIAATEIKLSDDDMTRIAGLERHRRYIDGTFWAKEDGPYTLESLWDE